jgi:hypothetical protein
MEKQSIHNKVESERAHFQKAKKDAIALIDEKVTNWKDKKREYKALSKKTFCYYVKSKKQLEQERLQEKIQSIQQQLSESKTD